MDHKWQKDSCAYLAHICWNKPASVYNKPCKFWFWEGFTFPSFIVYFLVVALTSSGWQISIFLSWQRSLKDNTYFHPGENWTRSLFHKYYTVIFFCILFSLIQWSISKQGWQCGTTHLEIKRRTFTDHSRKSTCF